MLHDAALCVRKIPRPQVDYASQAEVRRCGHLARCSLRIQEVGA